VISILLCTEVVSALHLLPPSFIRKRLYLAQALSFMTYQLTATRWTSQFPAGLKQIVTPSGQKEELIVACQQYAVEQKYSLLAGRSDNLITLFWDQDNRLVRIAIEEIK
jgi:hypothetical protein